MSKRFRKLSPTVDECKYHLGCVSEVSAEAILKDEMREYVRGEISNLLRRKERLEIIGMKVQSDHIHPVVWIPPKSAVSAVMGYLKGKLAIRLLQRDERLGNQFGGRHLGDAAIVSARSG